MKSRVGGHTLKPSGLEAPFLGGIFLRLPPVIAPRFYCSLYTVRTVYGALCRRKKMDKQ